MASTVPLLTNPVKFISGILLIFNKKSLTIPYHPISETWPGAANQRESLSALMAKVACRNAEPSLGTLEVELETCNATD